MANLLNNIKKISIYSLVFLLPLIFLPFSFEAYEFNKQYLLFFLVSLAFLTWLAKMIFCDKEIKFRRTPLDIPILIFMFISILSAAFSIDKTFSFFGFYGRFSDNLVGILSLWILYFLITNNTRSKSETPKESLRLPTGQAESETETKQISLNGLITVFLWSVFFVLLFSYFSLFGIWQIIGEKLKVLGFNLPGMMLNRIFNPIGGSFEALAMFLVIATVLLVGLILSKSKEGGIKHNKLLLAVHCLLLIGTVVLLMVIDFTAAWIVLGLTLLLFLIFAFWSRIFRERVNLLLIPIILLIVSIVFSFFQISKYNFQVSGFNILDPPREILLDQKTTWKVSWNTIKNYPVLGSGIGTFSEDFSKFKPKEFNQKNFWQIRFDKAANQVAEIISTTGVLGFLSWLAIISLFLMISWLLLKVQVKEGQLTNGNNYQLPLLFVFLALVLSQFVYYQNTTLAFLFWLTLGLGVISWQRPLKEKSFSFKDFPEMSLVFNIVLIVIALVILGSWFMAGRFYLADMRYKTGLSFAKIEDLEKAVKLNNLRATYHIALSRNYFVEASNALQKFTEGQDLTNIQLNFARAIDEARRASQISPNWVVPFENLGMIYRDIRNFAQGASQWAINSFSEAEKLEPTNPVFPTEIGKLLRDDKKIEEAKKEFEKALSLKSNYLDAKVQLALISEQENNLKEAISKLKEIVEENPLYVEAIFQLGRVYFNDGQIDEAISQFQRVLQIFPNHSNSLYALGMAYQKQGQKEKALEMFERVLELNPGNQDVIQKITELKKPTEEKTEKSK